MTTPTNWKARSSDSPGYNTGLIDDLGDELVVLPMKNYKGEEGYMICEEMRCPRRGTKHYAKVWCETLEKIEIALKVNTEMFGEYSKENCE